MAMLLYVKLLRAILCVCANGISAPQQTVGAKTRCDNAQAKVPDADYYVGLEGTFALAECNFTRRMWLQHAYRDNNAAVPRRPTGGVAEVSDVELMAFAWMVVKQRSTGAYAKSQTAHFMVPGMRKVVQFIGHPVATMDIRVSAGRNC